MTTTKKVNKAALKKSASLEEYRAAGGDDEMSSENQHIRDQLVRREVVQNISMLVYHFATNEGSLNGSEYSQEDVWELCRQTDWENTVSEHDNFCRFQNGEVIVKPGDDDREEAFDTWQEAGEALGIDDPQEHEAYEHWVVSDWFASKLKEKGEIVGELFGLTIWGRCTTGQMISMDSVIGAIAAEMQILTGQANDWSEKK